MDLSIKFNLLYLFLFESLNICVKAKRSEVEGTHILNDMATKKW